VLKHLQDELSDEKADSFTSGFGDGYKKGYEEAEKRAKEQTEFHHKYECGKGGLPMGVQVDLRDVLDARPDAKGVYHLHIGGSPLKDADAKQLKAEADSLLRMRLWTIMQETVKQRAIEKAVLNSENWEQALAGKMMLHDLGLIRSIAEGAAKYGSLQSKT
jgi:hypothetical protein